MNENKPFPNSGPATGYKSTPLNEVAENFKQKTSSALHEGAAGISGAANDAQKDLSDDMEQLRSDVASMRNTITLFVTASGDEAAKAAGKVRDAVASHAGAAASAGAEAATAAKEQIKTFATELEGMARRQPLGSLAGALVVGVVIGLLSKRG